MIDRESTLIVTAIGGAEIISYGTLYYCVAVLAKDIARDLEITEEWIFTCFSFALFASALVSLMAGRLMDQYGAGRTMTVASIAAGISLGIAAVCWDATGFAVALFGMQIASAFLFYEAGFVFLVQRDPSRAKEQITLLTLIVGFSSTLFWPLTSILLTLISWRFVFGIYAIANFMIALPLTMWALQKRPGVRSHQKQIRKLQASSRNNVKPTDFAFIAVGFSLTTFIFSAFLGQMIPILSSIGLGAAGAWISILFGPSQVLIRLFAASFTNRLAPIQLTILSCVLLFVATLFVAMSSHSLLGAIVFMIFLGFSSGLNSICRGTLPLSVFGEEGYGGRVGLITGARLLTAAFAPFLFSFIQHRYGIAIALASLAICGLGSVFSFALVKTQPERATEQVDRI